MTYSKKVAAALAAGVCIVAIAAPASAQTRDYNVPAGSLKSALDAYARQSGRQVIYKVDEVRSVRSPGAKGALSADAALRALLAGTGFTVRSDASGAIAIVRSGNVTPEAGQTTPPSGAEASNEGQQEIIVTGTNIRGISADYQPITRIDRRDIEASGSGTTEQFMRTLPQNFAATDPATAVSNTPSTQRNLNPFSGAGVNLNGLGPSSTLVLLNGRRLSSGGLNGDFVDVSLIPLAAIDRIEVLTDGASAIYGADAISGVVNFITRTDFEGAQTSLRYGNSTDGGGRELGISQVAGTRWTGGNIFGTINYLDQQPVYVSQRDFIRDVGAGSIIIPRQKRFGAMLNGSQTLWDGGEFSIDGFYSNRTYAQSSFQNSAGSTDNAEGYARQYGVASGLRQTIGAWRGSLDLNYSATRQSVTDDLRIGTFQSIATNRGRTQLASASLRFDGPVIDLASGAPVRMSVGAEYRYESLSKDSVTGGTFFSSFDSDRRISSIYAEAFAPIIGEGNALPWLKRLEISIAGRFDNYTDFGSSGFLPKIGLLFAPTQSLIFRGTYGRSYHAPSLPQLDLTSTYTVARLSNPADSDGFTNTLIDNSASNPDLGPERSRSFTAGVDWRPGSATLSVSYFNIDFSGRIGKPPLGGSLFTIFSRPALAAPYLTIPADPASVAAIYVNNPVSGTIPGGQGAVEAFLDNRLRNLAASHVSGLQVSGSWSINTPAGRFTPSIAANLLFDVKFKAGSAQPWVETVNTAFNPLAFKMRGGVAWERSGINAGINANYAGNYRNTSLAPVQTVSSWLTFDLNLGYQFRQPGSLLNGTRVALTAQNIFDRDPPHINPPPAPSQNLGFDPSNASPLGRFIAIQLTKDW